MDVNLENRDELIEQFQPYVHSIVHKLVKSMSLPKENIDEYISAGYLGLVEAAGRFNPDLGRPFESFAYLRIRGSVIDCIRDSSDLSAHAYNQIRAAKAAQELRVEQSTQEEGRAATPEKRERLAEIIDYLAQCGLAYRLSMADVEDSLVDEAESPEELVSHKDTAQLLFRLVHELPEKEQRIVKGYYFEDRSFAEIADEDESLSRSWVSRIHSRALESLKKKMLRELNP